MAHQLIAQLKDGDPVQQFFVLRSAETRTNKSGKPFLSLVLGDKSGAIKAKVWSEVLEKCRAKGPFAAGVQVGLKGQVRTYEGGLEINVQYLENVESIRVRGGDLGDFDPELLIQATAYDREQLWQELLQMAESHLEEPLRALVLHLLEQHRADIIECPAARVYHHPYLGGLLEHTWSVARHAVQSIQVYTDLNASLVLAGAILHDLGKVKEFTSPEAPARTLAGELLGHIALGWEMVREAARTLDFPDAELLVQLEHIILSHHGSLEFGSPVLPKTREALLVYYLDDLDAKLKMMEQHLEADTGESDFTSFHRALQRGLYKGAARQTVPEAAAPEAKNSKNQ